MKTDRRKRIVSERLARTLFPLALGICAAIAVLIPGTYLLLELSRARQEATVYGQILAENIRKLAAESPQLWKYQATKYALMLDGFVLHKGVLEIVLVDEQGRTISQLAEEGRRTLGRGGRSEALGPGWLEFPVTGDPAPVIFNNRQIGTASVVISGRGIVLPSLTAFLLCASLGIGLAFFSYRLPLQAVHALEGEILAYQQSLEERVDQRTRELHESTLKALCLAEDADAANRAKSEFLANMSHELRTPLNHIIGFTELVVDKQFGPLNAQQEEFLGDALRSSRHLLELINDILDLSKVEAGKMVLSLSSITLRSLLENSLTMVKEKALKHRIRITVEDRGAPETFQADERKVKQILYNLLSNAVKFTPDGGSIQVTAGGADGADGGRGVLISIADSGIGIAAGDLERIFHPFEQGDGSAGRRFEGTGLGLSLTRELVQLHGGRIWAESEGEGKGSRFHVLIPSQEEPGA